MSKNFPLEIERKFLIKMPDISVLQQQPLYMHIDMEQAYLPQNEDCSGLRVRKSTLNGKTSYKKTYKKSITSVTRIELEDDISEQTYKDMVFNADPDSTPIKKVRHCFMYKDQLFELDVYTFWDDRATLELELDNENQEIEIPPFIDVIKEITDDKRYSNRALSYSVITEDI